MDDSTVKEMIVRHDEAINHVTTSIDRLATTVEKTDDKMDKVIQALSQNAVILEKIANIDSSNKDSVNRLHKRIDAVEASIEHKEDAMSVRLNEVAIDANKGGKLYDLIVYTAKALAWALPITIAVVTVLLWVIKHA
jgi:CII-binding regulator of phage lambda lysogenization HflD